MTKITFISDTHNKHSRLCIQPTDILIHAGDFSAMGRHKEVNSFLSWFNKQPAKHLIYCAGNHDLSYETKPAFKQEMINKYPDLIYLEHSSIKIEGIKIFGSPYTPAFHNWAFMYPRNPPSGSLGGKMDMANKLWNSIPRDTDILVAHGPLNGILDRCRNQSPGYPDNAGCEILRHRVEEIGTIKIVCHGHIHEGRGCDYRTLAPTMVINASICDLSYQPNNKPIVIEYETGEILDF